MRCWGDNFETLVCPNSIWEHGRRKWTKNGFLMVVLLKYVIFEENQLKSRISLYGLEI